MKTAVVVVAHGSRRSEYTGPELRRVAESVGRRMPGVSVVYGALQFNSPSLAEAVAEVVAAGAGRVIIAPMFLFSGNHVARDIPGEIRVLRERFPAVELTYAGHIGADERLVDILVDRIREVAADAVY